MDMELQNIPFSEKEISIIASDSRFRSFIEVNADSDVASLRLKYLTGPDRTVYDFAITQIECRQRYSKKLADTLAHFDDFLFPDILACEQSTSDAMASFHVGLVRNTPSLCDMTAGLGIDCMHIAAAGSEVTACEIDPMRAGVLSYNAIGLGVGQLIRVRNTDSVEALKKGELSADTLFIDPARRDSDGRRVFGISDCTPDLIAIEPYVARHFNRMVAKLSPMLDVSAVARSLSVVTDIYVIGTSTECRELVSISLPSEGQKDGNPTIHAVTLSAQDTLSLSFNRAEEAEAQCIFATPTKGDILIIPYPAIIKAGAFRFTAEKYHLSKIAPNTHLYFTSEKDSHENIPGQKIIIEDIVEWRSKNIKRLKNLVPQGWITVKNFGMSADELRSRLGIRPGGTSRIIGFTDNAGMRLLAIGRIADSL